MFPYWVHPCSAGVGRTGCYVALDTLLQHVEEHDFIDVFGLVSEMRQHRNHMIQTEVHMKPRNMGHFGDIENVLLF